MNLKTSLILLALLIGLSVPGSDATKKRKLNYCILDNFYECMIEPFWVNTAELNGTGIPGNDDAFENLCHNLHDVMPYCLRKYANRCFSPLTATIMDSIIMRSMQQGMSKFCEPGGPFRTKFLKHSPCLISTVKLSTEYRQKCVKMLQQQTEWADVQFKAKENKPTLSDVFRNYCCAYSNWENCIVDQLEEQCGGEEAGSIIKDLIYQLSFHIVPNLCPFKRFNSRSPSNECIRDEFVPPADFIPKGILSTNLFSYIFSYGCPNVGYGVFLSRDF